MARKAEKKIENNISDEGLLSKNRAWEDEVLHTPTRPEWRKRFIRTLMLWAEKPTSLEILQFCLEYRIPRRRLYDWSAKYPEIKDALDDMRLLIACHRRVGTITKALDGGYAYRDMHMYDSEWNAINKYHSDMKKEEEKQAHTFIITSDKPKVITAEELEEIQKRERNDR